MSKQGLKASLSLCQIFDYLKAICEATDDNEFLPTVDKAHLLSFEFKLFDQICFYLLHKIKPCQGVPWPIVDKKQHTLFIKKLFEEIELIKSSYSWIKFPNFQKSHFLDPRAESDKAVEFLLKLCSLTVQVLTNSRREDSNLGSLQEEIDILNGIIEKKKSESRELDEEIERISSLGPALDEISLELIDRHLISSSEDFRQDALFKVQEELEVILLQMITESINESR